MTALGDPSFSPQGPDGPPGSPTDQSGGQSSAGNAVLSEEEARFTELFDVIHSLVYEPEPGLFADQITTLSAKFNVDHAKFESAIDQAVVFLRERRDKIEDTIHYISDSRVGLKSTLERDLRRLEFGDRPRHRATFVLQAPRASRRNRRAVTHVLDVPDPIRHQPARETSTAQRGLIHGKELTDVTMDLISELAIACGEGPPLAEDAVQQIAVEANAFIRRLLTTAAEKVECDPPAVVTAGPLLRVVEALFPPAALEAAEAAFVMGALSDTILLPWHATSAFRDAPASAFRQPVLRPAPRRETNARFF